MIGLLLHPRGFLIGRELSIWLIVPANHLQCKKKKASYESLSALLKKTLQRLVQTDRNLPTPLPEISDDNYFLVGNWKMAKAIPPRISRGTIKLMKFSNLSLGRIQQAIRPSWKVQKSYIPETLDHVKNTVEDVQGIISGTNTKDIFTSLKQALSMFDSSLLGKEPDKQVQQPS